MQSPRLLTSLQVGCWRRLGKEAVILSQGPATLWAFVHVCSCVSVHWSQNCFLLGFFFFSLWFLGPHLQYTEVPRLGVELELQLPAYTTDRAMRDSSCICDLHPSSWQCQILNPLSGARDGTCVLMHPRWAPYRELQRELPNDCFRLDCLSFEGRRLLISFQWYIPSRALSRLSINYMLLETCSG